MNIVTIILYLGGQRSGLDSPAGWREALVTHCQLKTMVLYVLAGYLSGILNIISNNYLFNTWFGFKALST